MASLALRLTRLEDALRGGDEAPTRVALMGADGVTREASGEAVDPAMVLVFLVRDEPAQIGPSPSPASGVSRNGQRI
jgi:hypothetical protein